jgi:hypothetical protein
MKEASERFRNPRDKRFFLIKRFQSTSTRSPFRPGIAGSALSSNAAELVELVPVSLPGLAPSAKKGV